MPGCMADHKDLFDPNLAECVHSFNIKFFFVFFYFFFFFTFIFANAIISWPSEFMNNVAVKSSQVTIS